MLRREQKSVRQAALVSELIEWRLDATDPVERQLAGQLLLDALSKRSRLTAASSGSSVSPAP